MKICIVIQSEAFRDSAGMRIRYDRFRDCLTDPDVTLEAIPCDELAANTALAHDVYIFCKTFDMTALLFARRVRAAGKIVGQDLFDDYFSQHDDARLERFRAWMRDMAPVTQFAICSTPRMVEVLRPYLPGIRIVAVDDPIIGYDPLLVAALAETKVQRARQSRVLDVAWFGIGDNPYFRVGLSDLVACEPALARIKRRGWRICLRIVTNRRPFDEGHGEMLRVFGIEHEVVEWTEQVERDALMRAAVAILPVNGQPFSRAKSMNRAITALNGGCQVLSLGYPLYERLDDYLYRSADALIDDLEAGTCRVRAERVAGLTAALSALANPFDSASAFVQEARAAMTGSMRSTSPLVCLINGRVTTFGAHKIASGLGGVSVATIFNTLQWNFPVRFDRVDNEIRMRVTLAFARRFSVPLRYASTSIRILDLDLHDVDLAALGMRSLLIYQSAETAPLQSLAFYDDVMAFIADACRAAFGAVDILLSDTSPLHRRPPNLARAA